MGAPDYLYGDPRNAKSPTLWAGLSARFETEAFGSPTWARTRDLRINSPALSSLDGEKVEDV